jgi:hypothetical protein
LLHVVGNGGRPAPGQDQVGGAPQFGAPPAHRHADFAGREQLVVVLGIADAEHVVRRQPQHAQCLAQAGRLADRLRQDHDAAGVEQERQRQPQLLDRAQRRVRIGGIEFGDAGAGTDRDPALAQQFQQPKSRRRGQHDRPPDLRERQHRPVFGHDGIEQPEVADQHAQVVEDPAGDQHDPEAALAGRADRDPHGRIEPTALGDRAVVVEREHAQPHRPPTIAAPMRRRCPPSCPPWRMATGIVDGHSLVS